MDPHEQTEWREADRLFAELAECGPDQRAAHLAALALPASLRDKLDRLLDSTARRHPLLDSDNPFDVVPAAVAAAAEAERRGETVGEWQLDELIGSGGMATVYLAHRQGRDYRQHAAVKLLRMVLHDDVSERHFRRERQILARLQHPNIATMLDGGVGNDGIPYLAMQHVAGERIDHWCDRHELGVQARVRLFLQVCAAVAYAHRQLVVHCDIKPGNILVDAEGRAILLDFGIAALQNAGDDAAGTWVHALTPEYAAPEQASVDRAATSPDVRVDVYGLGAVLYKLLGGHAPGMRTGMVPAASTIAPPKRARELRGDLDAILATALATDPAQRYTDADALRRDLVAWLAQRPVAARRGTRIYRFGKWSRRHRGLLAAGIAVLAIVTAGTMATAWQAHRALHEAQRTRNVLGYVQNLLAALVPRMGDPMRDRSSILAHAADEAGTRFADDDNSRADVEATLADLNARIGNYGAADELYRRALPVLLDAHGTEDPQVAAMLADWADTRAQLDGADHARILADYAAAIAVLARYPEASMALSRARLGYASELGETDHADEALRVLEDDRAQPPAGDALDVARLQMRNIAVHASIQLRLGNKTAARRLLDAGLQQARKRLPADDGILSRLLVLHGNAQLPDGDLALARVDFDVAIAILDTLYPEGNESTIDALQSYALLLRYTGDVPAAITATRRALDIAGRRLGTHHSAYAALTSDLGSLQLAIGHYAAAAESYRHAVESYTRSYGPEHVATAIVLGNLADALYEQGQLEPALAARERALGITCRIQGDNSPRCASQHSGKGRILLAMGRGTEAGNEFDSALATYRKHDGEHSLSTMSLLAWSAEAARQTGELERANRRMAAAMAILPTLPDPHGRTGSIARFLDLRLRCRTGPLDACRKDAAAVQTDLGRFFPPQHPFMREIAHWSQAR